MGLVLPTYFTAVDNYSNTMWAMGRAQQSFNDKVAAATTKLLAFGEAGSLISGTIFTGKAVMDYETELQNLKALTGATAIEFSKFKSIIEDVAHTTRRSSVEVAQSFTTIANAMPELLQDAKGLGMVTEASIQLAKAARLELTPAAEATTTILNQFGKGAEYASTLVDMMAAGSKYGSAEISDLALSMKEFGAQAKLAGISVQESVGLTELVSKFRKGTQAGIELRNVLLYMSSKGVLDAAANADLMRLHVNMGIVTNTALPLVDRLRELSKVAHDGAALYHIFNRENVAMATHILQNVDKFEQLTPLIGESGNAARMAAENTNTLANRLIELKNTFVTSVTTSRSMAVALDAIKNIVVFLTDHMDLFVAVLGLAATRMTVLKLATWGTETALVAYKFAAGAAAVFTGNLTGALLNDAVAARGAAAAYGLLNAGLVGILTPIGLAAGALWLFKSISESTYNSAVEMPDALDDMKDGFKQIHKPITEAAYALQQYNDAVDKYNTKQAAIQRLQLHEEFNKRTGREDTWGDFFAQIPDAIRAGNGVLEAPDMKNFLTQEQINEIQANNQTNNSTGQVKHVVELQAPAGWGVKQIAGNNTSNGIVITSTGGAN